MSVVLNRTNINSDLCFVKHCVSGWLSEVFLTLVDAIK